MKRITCLLLCLVACAGTDDRQMVELPPLPPQPPAPVATMPPVVVPTTTTTTIPPLDLGAIATAIEQARTDWGPCGEWRELALQEGWTADEWPVLSRVLYRESRCDPTVISPTRDYGLVQANKKAHRETVEEMFGMPFEQAMLDPVLNLRFGSWLQNASGWSPWAWLEMD